ncbi:hypothetical protein COLO4_01859, partial [Corchorus olitorius]
MPAAPGFACRAPRQRRWRASQCGSHRSRSRRTSARLPFCAAPYCPPPAWRSKPDTLTTDSSAPPPGSRSPR